MKKLIFTGIFLLVAILGIALLRCNTGSAGDCTETDSTVIKRDTLYRYGLPIELFAAKYDTIRPRQTLAEVLMAYGLSAQKIYNLTTQCPDTVFDVRKVRAGQPCILLAEPDSTAATPRYFIYEANAKEYVVFDLIADSVTRGTLPTSWHERSAQGTVESSLWNAMLDGGASPQLAVMLSHIFG